MAGNFQRAGLDIAKECLKIWKELLKRLDLKTLPVATTRESPTDALRPGKPSFGAQDTAAEISSMRTEPGRHIEQDDVFIAVKAEQPLTASL